MGALTMLVGLACGDTTSGGGGAGGSGAHGSGGSPPVCNAGDPFPYASRCNALIDVEEEGICLTFAMNDGREPRLLDIAEATCVLTALRDRTCGDWW